MIASHNNLILPVLAETIIGALETEGIIFQTISKHNDGVGYNRRKNKIILDPLYFKTRIFSQTILSNLFPVISAVEKLKFIDLTDSEKEAYKSIMLKPISVILYYAIHIFNRFRPGMLLINKDIINWYNEFFYHSLYENTEHLTLISRYFAVPFSRMYVKYANTEFDQPLNTGSLFSNEDVKKIKGVLPYNFLQIYNNIENMNGVDDEESLTAVKEWFGCFIKELLKCFYNQSKNISYDDDLTERLEFKALTHNALISAYSKSCRTLLKAQDVPAINNPLFRELFITAEPLAQSLCLVYRGGKGASFEDWQSIAAKGLTLL